MKNAKSTYESLQMELEARTEQLKKLEHFDRKTENDFKNLHERMEEMRNEIDSKFNNVTAVIRKFEMEKQRLNQLKFFYNHNSRDLSQQVYIYIYIYI